MSLKEIISGLRLSFLSEENMDLANAIIICMMFGAPPGPRKSASEARVDSLAGDCYPLQDTARLARPGLAQAGNPRQGNASG